MCDHPRQHTLTVGHIRDLDNKLVKVNGQPQETRYCGLCGHNVRPDGSTARAHVHATAPVLA